MWAGRLNLLFLEKEKKNRWDSYNLNGRGRRGAKCETTGQLVIHMETGNESHLELNATVTQKVMEINLLNKPQKKKKFVLNFWNHFWGISIILLIITVSLLRVASLISANILSTLSLSSPSRCGGRPCGAEPRQLHRAVALKTTHWSQNKYRVKEGSGQDVLWLLAQGNEKLEM